ncbi:hypothetical protein GJ496_002218 [Pomphorhynchus laevis]|nr:hypothetical protein GJ496_002218 [Pomphorhynchus laevis]
MRRNKQLNSTSNVNIENNADIVIVNNMYSFSTSKFCDIQFACDTSACEYWTTMTVSLDLRKYANEDFVDLVLPRNYER